VISYAGHLPAGTDRRQQGSGRCLPVAAGGTGGPGQNVAVAGHLLILVDKVLIIQ